MTPEHDAELRKTFPILFQGPLLNDEPIRCGDGWFRLLWLALAGIEQTITKRVMRPAVTLDLRPYRLEQIKEKFGALEIYTANMCCYREPEFRAVYDLARRLSLVTCDVCGEPGTLGTENMLVAVRCDEHRETRPRP